jgi:hypothetical protein
MNGDVTVRVAPPLTTRMLIHTSTSLASPPLSSRQIRQLREFAKRIIAYETGENISSGTEDPAAFPVSEKLRRHMASIMGTTGFRALLARALELAAAEIPLLCAVHVKADGSLEGLEKLEEQATPGEFSKGRMVLLAELLGLLVVFIGESLTLRVVREVWPRLSIGDLEFAKGDGNEIEKAE